MSYERDLNNAAIKFADKHFIKCPFCQSNIPDWKVEESNISSRIKKYSLLCRQCEGIINIEASNEEAFKTGKFNKIVLGNEGRGQYNYRKRGSEVTLDEIREMCGDDMSVPIVAPTPVEERTSVTRSTITTSDRSDVRRSEPAPVRRTTSTPTSSYSSSSRPSSTSSYIKPSRPFGILSLLFGLISLVGGIIIMTKVYSNAAGVYAFAFLFFSLAVVGLVFSIQGLRKSRNRITSIFGRVFSIIGMAMPLLYYVLLFILSLVY